MVDSDQTKIEDKPVVEGDNDDEQKPLYNSRQVQDVVKREREKALKKGREMALEELQQQQPAAQPQAQPVQQPQQQPQQQPSNLGGMTQMTPEQIRALIAEEAPKHLQSQLQHQQASKQAEGFVSKMRAAEAKYPGLEAKLEKLDWTHMGPVIRVLDNASNPGDIMKELLDNPSKLGSLIGLAHTQPALADSMVKELSASILTNQAAQAQETQSSDPLDQMTTSNVGSDTGVKGSVRDFKRKYRG